MNFIKKTKCFSIIIFFILAVLLFVLNDYTTSYFLKNIELLNLFLFDENKNNREYILQLVNNFFLVFVVYKLLKIITSCLTEITVCGLGFICELFINDYNDINTTLQLFRSGNSNISGPKILSFDHILRPTLINFLNIILYIQTYRGYFIAFFNYLESCELLNNENYKNYIIYIVSFFSLYSLFFMFIYYKFGVKKVEFRNKLTTVIMNIFCFKDYYVTNKNVRIDNENYKTLLLKSITNSEFVLFFQKIFSVCDATIFCTISNLFLYFILNKMIEIVENNSNSENDKLNIIKAVFVLHTVFLSNMVSLMLSFQFFSENFGILKSCICNFCIQSLKTMIKGGKSVKNRIFSENPIKTIELGDLLSNNINIAQISYKTPENELITEKGSIKNLKLSFPSKILIKGSNASGKSSLLKILTNVYHYKGLFLINGEDSDIARYPVSYMPQSVDEGIDFWKNKLQNLKMPIETCDKSVGQLKFKFFTETLNKKEENLFLLDEPFNNLDPEKKKIID